MEISVNDVDALKVTLKLQWVGQNIIRETWMV